MSNLPSVPSDSAVSKRSLRFGEFRLDAGERKLWRGGESVDVSPKAFDVLHFLASRSGQLTTKRELLNALWPDVVVSDAVVKVAIAEVRRALGDNARSPDYVETVQRSGYRFIAPVDRSERRTIHSVESRPGSSPLVGRTSVSSALDAHLRSVLEGSRHAVFVTGEAGIGKTALVDSFLEAVRAQGVLVAKGQCRESYGHGEAFLPIFEALGALCRGPRGDWALSILERHCPSWLVQMPWLSSDDDRVGLEEPPLQSSRAGMLREIAEGLEVISRDVPLVVVCEDLHWSDPSTIDALSALMQRTEPAALLVVGTYRPDEVKRRDHPIRALRDRVVGNGVGREIELGLLTESDIGKFASNRLGGAVPDTIVSLLHRRSEGNPLFMTAFLEQLVSLQYLELDSTGWQLRRRLEEIETLLPERLRGVLERQIAHLSPERMKILECASVVGPDFDGATIASVLASDEAGTEETLEEIGRQEIVLHSLGSKRLDGGEFTGRYRFVHALMQHAVYSRIGSARRSRLHARVAREIASKGDATPAELAFHFHAAGQASEAIDAWEQAGTQANERWATREAIGHFERALSTLAKLPASTERDEREFRLLVKIGGPLSDVFGPGSPRVADVYHRADELSVGLEENPALVALLAGLFTYRVGRAQHREAEKLAARITRIVEPLDNDLMRQSALLVTGIASLYRGRCSDAVESMDRALALSSSEAVYNWGQDARALCYMFSSFALHLLGRPDEARRRADMGVACARSGHDAHLLSTAIQFESILLRWQGDVAGVRERAERVEAISAENGLELWAPVTGWVRGWVRAQSGSIHEGLAEMKIHLDRYEESGTDASRTDYLAATAEVCCATGDFDAGLELIQEAFDRIERTGERLAEAEVHRVHGLLLAARGAARFGTNGSKDDDRGAAEEAIRRALAVAEAQGALAWRLRAALALHRVSAGGSREREARAILSQTLGAFPTPNGLPEYRQAIEVLGSTHE